MASDWWVIGLGLASLLLAYYLPARPPRDDE
jgi:hypothetical protein